MPKGIKMENVCWPDIETAFNNRWPIVIPLGAGCKEHGLHLPMNTDQIIAEKFADLLLHEYEILIAPTITDNYFPAFEEYPGSSTLSLETSRNLIVEKCMVWSKQGANKFYVLNTGISTKKPLSEAKQILQTFNPDILFEYLDLSLLYEHPEIKKIMQQKVGTHADEIETSIMLYLMPEIVRMDKAKAEENLDKPGPLTRVPNSLDKTISLTGAWGNPTLATREKGHVAVTVIKEMLTAGLKPFLSNSAITLCS
jgi:creatinine amidohydrolase